MTKVTYEIRYYENDKPTKMRVKCYSMQQPAHEDFEEIKARCDEAWLVKVTEDVVAGHAGKRLQRSIASHDAR